MPTYTFDEWSSLQKVIFIPEQKLISIKTGYTQLDAEVDLYSSWKEWLLYNDNSKWSSAFSSVGGEPTGSNQYSPKYFFLKNGWKIYCNNVNVIVQINLYTDDGSSPFIIINSSVVNRVSDIPIIKSEVEKRLEYRDRIYYDENSSYSSVIYPNGTIFNPINNLSDAISIANIYNIKKIYMLSDINFSSGNTFENYSIYADMDNLSLNIPDNNYINNIECNGFIINGNFGGGNNKFIDCIIENLLDTSGQLKDCQINGNIRIWDELISTSCYSGIIEPNKSIWDMNSNRTTKLSLRNYSGDIKLLNSNNINDISNINVLGGIVELDSTCISGTTYIGGICEIINNSGTGCTIIPQSINLKSIEDSVWNAPIIEHIEVGSVGNALNNVSAGASPELIAAAVWNQSLTGLTEPNSASELLNFLVSSALDSTSSLAFISNDIKRVLGLSQENFRIKNHMYDGDLLESATICIYDNSNDCDNDINPLAQYSMDAIYDSTGKLINYKVTKV